MKQQGVYFTENPHSVFIPYADFVQSPFNEAIRIAIEYGAVGIIFLVILGITLVRSNKKTTNRSKITYLGILCWCIFAQFSYPMLIGPMVIVLLVYIAIQANGTAILWRLPDGLARIGNLPACLFLGVGLYTFCFPLQQELTARKTWGNARTVYATEHYNDCLYHFQLALPQLYNNGKFLAEYGKALAMTERTEEARLVLEKAEKQECNSILYTTMGDCYKVQKEIAKAEEQYQKALDLIPNRLYPIYLKMCLYRDSGNHGKAIQLAKTLLNKKVKIASDAVEEMQTEAREMINELANMQAQTINREKRQEATKLATSASCLTPLTARKGGTP